MEILGVHVIFRDVYRYVVQLLSLPWKNPGTSDIPCTCISCETQTLPNLSMIQLAYHPWVVFYGKCRYLNIPYMDAMGLEIVGTSRGKKIIESGSGGAFFFLLKMP